MSKTPEKMRDEAREYRELLEHMDGRVLNVAIEEAAAALDKSADALEEANKAT